MTEAEGHGDGVAIAGSSDKIFVELPCLVERGPRIESGGIVRLTAREGVRGLTMFLAAGCGAQAQMKGIWWMPWH